MTMSSSFVTVRDVGKRPREIRADGSKDFVPGEERWHVFRVYENLRQREAAEEESARKRVLEEEETQDTSEDKSTSKESDKPRVKTPQKVIDLLMSARGELEFLTELISLIEQQQFLNVNHVAQKTSPDEKARHDIINLQRRRSQLSRIADRLQSGMFELKSRWDIEKTYLEDVLEIRKYWYLSRLPIHLGGHFFVHIALRWPSPREGLSGQQFRKYSSATQFLLLPNKIGRATIVVAPTFANSTSEDITGTASDMRKALTEPRTRVVEGFSAILKELEVQFLLHCWRAIEDRLLEEIKVLYQEVLDLDGSLEALKYLVHAAVLRREKAIAMPSSERGRNAGPHTALATMTSKSIEKSFNTMTNVQKSLTARKIEMFSQTVECHEEFESVALRRLAYLLNLVRVPMLVRKVKGSKDEATLLPTLQSWIRKRAKSFSEEN